MQGIAEEAEELLVQYPWPGDGRELENAIERAVGLGVTDWVLPEDLPETLFEAAPVGRDQISLIGWASEAEAILDAYREGGGDYKQAANC